MPNFINLEQIAVKVMYEEIMEVSLKDIDHKVHKKLTRLHKMDGGAERRKEYGIA